MTGTDDLPIEKEAAEPQPVECLGMTFESEDARREHFLERLRAALPELRKRPDFPKGEDEDILRMSDPPWYTACPNPFLAEFAKQYGTRHDPDDDYHREPLAVDVSVGKGDALYRAHSYHTKVPHLAIVPSILHYTKPGDIVLDGFCGSGMTGVAAQWCGAAPDAYRRSLESEWKKDGRDPPEWGARRVVLGDLSPAATFIAANYNIPFDVDEFAAAAKKLLDDVDKEVGWMYETLHADGKTKGRINYTVWSEVFACPECGGEIVFGKEAVDAASQRVKKEFPCPECGAALTKRRLSKRWITRHDKDLERSVRGFLRTPTLVEYTLDGRSKHHKFLDESDLEIVDRISTMEPPQWFPRDRMMHADDDVTKWGDNYASGVASFQYVHHLFLPRAAQALASLWQLACSHREARLRNMLMFLAEQAIVGMSVLNRYSATHFSQVNRWMPGLLRELSQTAEPSPRYNLGGRAQRLPGAFTPAPSLPAFAMTSTGDCSALPLPSDSIDYIFTDPPFGDNLAYAELNFVVEAFHRVFTNRTPEAIVSATQRKQLDEYQALMSKCFAEYARVLKPGRWMTVVFHNSRNSVWTAIQEGLSAAGLVVADVRTLDKQSGSYNQVMASGAVKQDLVISVYKPSHDLEARFKLEAGTEDGMWAFVRDHLKNLPVFVAKGRVAEVVAERLDYLLFDRMVAFHVQRGVSIPLSAAEFYEGLAQRFAVRHGMHFLPEQAIEHDSKRLRAAAKIEQLSLIVTDEKSAIQWLRLQLKARPRSFQALHPDFVRELSGWQKHEQMLELSKLLEQNFLRYDGEGDIPSQIHAYLSSNHKPCRNRQKDDDLLRKKATDRWYVPDANKATDLEKLRERTLLREFETYRDPARRRLGQFRLEAVRAGFRRAWGRGDYGTILEVARKIPDRVLREDVQLLMWYDQAKTRVEAEGG